MDKEQPLVERAARAYQRANSTGTVSMDGIEAVLEVAQAENEKLREACRRIGRPEDNERSLMPSEMRMIARKALEDKTLSNGGLS